MEREQTRYFLIDGIRGFAILNMVLFHFLYDVYIIFGKNPHWYGKTEIYVWQQMICWTFIFISGFVWKWGKRKNLQRGLMLNAFGLVISAVTWIATPQEAVWFGILNFMGCAILLMFLLERMLEKIPPGLGLAAGFFLFLFFRKVQEGILGFGGRFVFSLPDEWYEAGVLTPFGFPFPEFLSSDYFPILPWIFLYICGFYAQMIFARKGEWKEFGRKKLPLMSVLGTKAIWIYLLHQPVNLLVSWMLFG